MIYQLPVTEGLSRIRTVFGHDLCNLCHRRMQLCAGETACADPSSSPLPFCRFLCSSETAVNYGWTLSASCWIESEPWKAGRTVGTTCACASAYGRRDAPSPVGLCLLCLGLSGFHSVITSRESFRPCEEDPKWTKRDLTPVTNGIKPEFLRPSP